MDLLWADKVDMGIESTSGQDQTLASDRFGRHTDHHLFIHSGHHIGVTGLADPRDTAILDADVGLVDAVIIDHQGIGNYQVECICLGDTRGLTHAIPQHLAATKLALVAIDGVVLLNFERERGITKSDSVASGGAKDLCVVRSANLVCHQALPFLCARAIQAGS